MELDQIIKTPAFHFGIAVIGMYLMIVVYRIGYVGRVRQLVFGIDPEKHKQLPGFFKMAWVQIFKNDYLKELFGDEYNDNDYLAD